MSRSGAYENVSDWSCDELHEVGGLEWLCACGVQFDQDNAVHLGAPSRVVISRLSAWAQSASSETITAAESSLVNFLSDRDKLRAFLVVPHKSGKSLLQILLGEAKLQKRLVLFVCQVLNEMVFEEPNEEMRSLAHKLVSAFSFLPVIVDRAFFADKLFETISNTHDVVKPMIVASLNGIFDTCTPSIVHQLTDLMVQTPALTQDALDALSGFELSREEKENVRRRVLDDLLSASSTKDLPAVMRFLVSTTDEANAMSTVDAFRKYLVVAQPNMRVTGLSMDDVNVFLMIQIKSALQFNKLFCAGYIKALEMCASSAEAELNTLDVWVLFALFSISSKRAKAEELIKNLSSAGKLNEENAQMAVAGHEKPLECLLSVVPELVYWCLSNTDEKLVAVGMSWAVALFETISNPSSLQDIVASLCTLVGIGSDVSKSNASQVLARLAEEQTKKLSAYGQIVQGLLVSHESIPLPIFASIVETIVKVTLLEPDDVEKESNMNVFATKMIGSTKLEAQKVGVVTVGAILNRMTTFCNAGTMDFDVIQRYFETVMQTIGDNAYAVNMFFDQLLANKNRGADLNQFLLDRLLTEIKGLLRDRTHESDEWYGLGQEDKCIDFSGTFSQSVVRHTLSLSRHRLLTASKKIAMVFSQNGLKILLDAIVSLDQDLEEVFGTYFRLPIAMFTRDGDLDDVSRSQRIQMVLMAHSWIVENLNYFAARPNRDCFQRLVHRVDLESLLMAYLDEEKTYIHPLQGNIFPKYPPVIKKAMQTPDPRYFFVSKYRSAFPTPRLELMNLLLEFKLPLSDDMDRKCVLSLLDDYQYILSGSTSRVDPPSNIITFITKDLLSSVISSEDQLDNLITNKILTILNIQLQLPIYKEKVKFADLLKSISGARKKEQCFTVYVEMLKDGTPPDVKLSMILLLRTILHSGPVTRVDYLGPEVTQLCDICRDSLKSSTPILPKASLKKILPIFFEHNARGLDDISALTKRGLSPDIFTGTKSEEWPSLKSDTFGLYFQHCFSYLNKKLAEVNKRIKSNSVGIIDEQSVLALLEMMNQTASLIHALLSTVSSFSVPSAVHRIVLNYGPAWMDSCTGLLDFLKDARQVDCDAVDSFINHVRDIGRSLQGVVDHVRRHERELQKNLPKLSKSLSAWIYSLKNTFTGVYDDGTGVRIGTLSERTIEGEEISSQATQ